MKRGGSLIWLQPAGNVALLHSTTLLSPRAKRWNFKAFDAHLQVFRALGPW